MTMIRGSMSLLFLQLLFLGCSGSHLQDQVVDIDDEVSASLMQLRGKLKAGAELGMMAGLDGAAGSMSMDAQYSFIQDLIKQHEAGQLKKLPGGIAEFLKSIHTNAVKVQTALHTEHTTQLDNVKKTQQEFHTCGTDHTKRLGGVDDTHAAKCAASQKAHCDCRVMEADASLDAKACETQVKCLKDIRDKKKKDVDDYLARTDHCETCGNSDYLKAAGSTKYDKMSAWLTSKQTSCKQFYTEKANEFDKLTGALDEAEKAYKNAKAHCDQAGTTHTEKTKECDGKLATATLEQCGYIDATTNACSVYGQCYVDAEGNWDRLVKTQNEDYPDRMSAWHAAEQMKCILGVFTIGGKPISEVALFQEATVTDAPDADAAVQKPADDDADGIEINAKNGEDCSKKTCDSEADCQKLSMKEDLAWPKPTKETCTPPPQICKDNVLDPKCKLDAGGKHQPKPQEHTLGGEAVCEASTEPVSRVGEVSEACEQCAA